jgi:hypothetical protein
MTTADELLKIRDVLQAVKHPIDLSSAESLELRVILEDIEELANEMRLVIVHGDEP